MMAWRASHRMWKWMAGILVVLSLSIGAYAAASGTAEKAGRGIQPTIIIDKSRAGDKCVEDTAYMRKNHMKLLLHERYETVHFGIRTKKYSLQNCISCHASSKDNSVIGSDTHFCQGCHTYAAVSLDCWECHSSKPNPLQPAVATTTPVPPVSVGGDKK